MNANLTRKQWLRALPTAAVVVICIAAATLWILRQNTNHIALQADCAIVGQVARDWVTTVAIDSSLVGPDKPADASSVSRWTVMSDKAREGAASVSTPALKENLTKWAEGFALYAKLRSDRREDKQPFSVEGRTGELETAYRAMDSVGPTADVLRTTCPQEWPPSVPPR